MKKTKKLSMLILGGLLALGVGAGLGASDFQRAEAANASFTLNVTALGGTAVLGNNNYSSGAERTATVDGVAIGSKAVTVNGANLQAQANNGVIYNTAALPGRLVSVVLTQTGTARAHSLYGGSSTRLVNNTAANYTVNGGTLVSTLTSATTTWTISTGTNYTYFCIKRGGNASQISSIVVTYEDASKTLVSIAVTTPPSKTNYFVGETLDLTNLVVTGTYSDASTEAVTGACTFSPAAGTTLGLSHTSVGVTHTATGKTTSFSITVSNPAPTIYLDKGSLNVEIADSDTIEVTPAYFSGTPTITAEFASTDDAIGTYATASVNGMVITITGTDAGDDTLNITATYGSESDTANAAITIKAPSLGEWEKVTSAAGLTEGKYIITIPATAGGTLMAMTNTNGTGAAPDAVNLTWSGSVPNKDVYDPTEPLGTTVIWDITTSGANYVVRPLNSTTTNLYATATNNGLRVGGTSDTWVIDFVTSYFTMMENNNNRFIQIYNSADFRSYNSITSGGQISSNADCFKIQFFKWTSSAPLTTTLTITGNLTNGSQYAGAFLDVSGLSFTANYVGGATASLLVSQLNDLPKLVLGTSTYQVSYTEGAITATGNVTLTVLADTLNSLSWESRVLVYNEGQTLTQSSVTAKYGSGNEVPLTFEDVTIYVFEGTWNPVTATIITTATVLNDFDHNGLSIRLGFEGVYSTTSTLTVNFILTTTYTEGGGAPTTASLVSNASELAAGDQIIIADKASSNALGAADGTYRTAVAVTFTSDDITTFGDATILTLGGNSSAWTLSSGTEYLYYTGSSNTLQTGTSSSNGNTWTIAISSGVATISNVGAPTRLLQYNKNTGQERFACYTSAQVKPAIYKLGSSSITEFNYNYLLDVLAGDYCDMTTLEELNLIHTRYNAMTESEIAHFNIEVIIGDDTNSYTGLEAYNEAMLKRALLMNEPSKGNNFGEDTAINEETSIAFIVIVAVLGVTAIGAFFFTRRKETN